MVEVCVESLAGVRAARAAGAERVELCTALGEGGLTPGAGLLEAALTVGIDVVVLVRPRGGDFLYDEDEFDVLARDVVLARERGAAGVALGILTRDGAIDRPRCARLVSLARPLAVTFHRAFDHVREPVAALESLIELGVERVLTSGQAATALAGQERLAALVRVARGRIEIIAAGGVRPENVATLWAASGVPAVHFSASVARPSAMEHRNPEVHLGAARAADDRFRHETDGARVRAMLSALAAAGARESSDPRGAPGPEPRPGG